MLYRDWSIRAKVIGWKPFYLYKTDNNDNDNNNDSNDDNNDRPIT